MLMIHASDPNKYALALLEALFLHEEMGDIVMSRQVCKRSTKPKLRRRYMYSPFGRLALLVLYMSDALM